MLTAYPLKTQVTKLHDRTDNETQQLLQPEGKAASCSLFQGGPTSEPHGPSERVPKTRPSGLLSCQQLFLYAAESSLHVSLLFTTTAGY